MGVVNIRCDYPVRATIMREYDKKSNRGRMVARVFSLQGLCLIVGPLLATMLLRPVRQAQMEPQEADEKANGEGKTT